MQHPYNLQEQFLKAVRREQSQVTVFLMNGFQLRGVVTGYDNYAVIIQSEGRQNMIYKHAISTISPAVAVSLREQTTPAP
ncbi:MAG TPA: RNA chaperone Hfq [Candidatus Avoscillospira avistercoris]|uniref:RNA-binding protein Hfq n=1 Tax=Candidatus Avoscillospira avistercoris TaxID=2840707 RepID=A0A9D1F8Z6_9FIRM|nr:RNA chaperone Hfq [Candidatus Avoscillospira avistercoris]